MICILEGPEDDSIRLETCCPNTIINIILGSHSTFSTLLSNDPYLRRAWRWFRKTRKMLPQYNNNHSKVLLCLTDTSLFIYIVFLFSLQLLSETFLIPILRNIIISVHRSSCEVPTLFLSDFNQTWIFSTNFLKNIQITNFMAILTDGRRDLTKPSRFSHFGESAWKKSNPSVYTKHKNDIG